MRPALVKYSPKPSGATFGNWIVAKSPRKVRSTAQLFVVDLELGNLRLPDVFVVGDEQGDEIVLGRNILNKLRILLDGPANLTDIPSL